MFFLNILNDYFIKFDKYVNIIISLHEYEKIILHKCFKTFMTHIYTTCSYYFINSAVNNFLYRIILNIIPN